MSFESSSKARPVTHYKNVIYLYCDGACKGNPGPGGCGIVLIYNGYRKNFGVYLGDNVTNNIAELEALRHGLSCIKDKSKPVVICSDSSYVIGLLSKGWKAKSNVELVEALREYIKEVPKLSFLQVPGHSKVPENEDADKIASFEARNRMEEGVLKEVSVPHGEKINKPKKAASEKKESSYKDPYYDDSGGHELEDPQSEEIRKLVEQEMAYEEFEEAEKKKDLNEWGIEED